MILLLTVTLCTLFLKFSRAEYHLNTPEIQRVAVKLLPTRVNIDHINNEVLVTPGVINVSMAQSLPLKFKHSHYYAEKSHSPRYSP